MRFHPAAVTALMLMAAVQASPAAPEGPRRSWDLSLFTWVKRVPAEPGAPANQHPQKVDATALARALGSVRLIVGKAEEPLFSSQEATDLARILAEALAVAGPGEDLELVSTYRRNASLFGGSLSLTARAFVQGGRLNLIVHDTRLEVVMVYNLDLRMPLFKFGSRTAASDVVLKAEGAEQQRPDWLALPLTAPAPVPALATTPPPAQAAPAGRLEERLRDLKRLWEQDLITAEEYARRKQELLREI